MRWLLVLGLILGIAQANAQTTDQRYTLGNSLILTGPNTIDASAPIYAPPSGSYSVLYAASLSGTGTDDFSTLLFTGSSPATYTFPQSVVNNFTGAISGVTLTTPSNLTAIGAVITGSQVLDNTYVTAGSGTSWTVSRPQAVGSRTLTSSIFPPGHGACVKSDTSATAPLTVTATTSTIHGAAGVVNGSPPTPGGSFVLFPGGEACLQADTNNNYLVIQFVPGVWFKSASNVGALTYAGLSGYPNYHLFCSGVVPAVNGDEFYTQLSYAGTMQVTGYNYIGTYTYLGASAVQVVGGSTNDAGILLLGAGNLSNNTNYAGQVSADYSFSLGTGTGFDNRIHANGSYYDSSLAAHTTIETSGSAPLTTSLAVDKINLLMAGGNISTALCWLSPKIGMGP